MLYSLSSLNDLKSRSDLRRRAMLVFLSVLLFASVAFGQGESKAVLLDDLGRFPCDGFRGYIDGLLSVLRDRPESDALVVNVGRGKYEIWAMLREEMIRNHIAYRRFDGSRVSYLREVGEEFKTQFFRVPSEKNKKQSHPKNYVLTSLTEPYLIEDRDFDDLCPPINYNDVFATIIEQNPQFTATILVRDRTISAAKKRKQAIVKYLTQERKVPPSRIKIFLTAKSDFAYGQDPYVEYRVIP
jgi:hypothetical protein